MWGVSSGTWLGLQVGGGPFAELEMVYDLLFFPALVGLALQPPDTQWFLELQLNSSCG